MKKRFKLITFGKKPYVTHEVFDNVEYRYVAKVATKRHGNMICKALNNSQKKEEVKVV